MVGRWLLFSAYIRSRLFDTPKADYLDLRNDKAEQYVPCAMRRHDSARRGRQSRSFGAIGRP